MWEGILDDMADDNKICFITCVNNEILYAKCLDFLNRLIVPPNITIEYKALRETSSMCDGYNKAMTESDARYKVYLHQDAYITYPYFIHRLINLFKERSIGLVGMIGSRTLPESCVWWESKDKYGWVIDTSDGFQREQKYLTCAKNKYEEVAAIDGLLMATQYDVPWRADLFDGWHFYDVAQCLEFRRAGYKIVVSVLPCSQVTHDCGIVNHTGYLKYRDILKAEYGEELLKILESRRAATAGARFIAPRSHDMHNVILLTNNYNDFRFSFLHEYFALEFSKLCIRMDIVDIKTGLNTLNSLYGRNTLFFLSFNGDGANIVTNNKSLFTVTGRPLITVLEDIAAQYPKMVSNTDTENVIFLIYDRNDGNYINRYIPEMRHFYFLGWWGICLEENFPNIRERSFDITFCGHVVPETDSFFNFAGQMRNGVSLQKFFNDVVDILLYNDSLTAAEAVERVAEHYNIQLIENVSIFHEIVFRAMIFVRDKRRTILLRSLAQCGFNVDYFGYKHEYDAIGENKLRYHEEINMKDNLALMSRSKIVLNNNSLTRAAVNTRQLSAMMAKAVVLTDSNELNDEYFAAGTDFAMFKNSELELIPDIAYDLLSAPDRMQDIADSGRRKAMNGFSLEKFVGNIMSVYNRHTEEAK